MIQYPIFNFMESITVQGTFTSSQITNCMLSFNEIILHHGTVLVLDGNSEHAEHVWRKTRLFCNVTFATALTVQIADFTLDLRIYFCVTI